MGEGVKLVENAIEQLDSLRSDERFSETYQEAISKADSMSAQAPTLPRRQPQAPKRLSTSTAHAFATPEDYYRCKYFEALDYVSDCLKTRVVDKHAPVLVAIEQLLISSWSGNAVSTSNLNIVVQHYQTDLDAYRLKAQLQCLENLNTTKNDENNVSTILKAIGNSSTRSILPQVVQMCQLYVVHPATTATPERTFSTLWRLKSYLRSTMS